MAEPGITQPGAQALILAMDGFALEQHGEPFAMLKAASLGDRDR
jgi:hypothetical protein